MVQSMSDSSYQQPQVVAHNLGESEYNRQRFDPQPKDEYYIHLSDIRLFLEDYSRETFPCLLDYGCGGSPYRELFQVGSYARADYVDCGNLDCLISADGKVDLPDNSYDAVLSTQVLEHVFSPRAYLAEALRLLRPGGKLILTTHGIWEDHGCPYDFRRWTRDGLSKELREAGFEVKKVARLTTGTRAILFLFSRILGTLHESRLHLLGWAFRLLRRSSFGTAELRHRWMDRQFGDRRVVFGDEPGNGIYLALGIEGVKPRAG
jgi:SAM-dependent methyltransferase